MSLTKVSTDGVKDDAVTSAKIPANSVGTSELAALSVTNLEIGNGMVVNSKIGDQAVSLDKLEHGTSSNDGKFLRANNGADPTFETVNTDLVNDTSPQLGGDLASNGNDIVFAGTDKAKFGTDKLAIYHDGNHSLIEETGTGNLFLKTTGSEIAFLGDGGSDYMVRGIQNGATELYHNASKKFESTSYGSRTTGYHTQSAPVSWLAYADSQWYTMTAGQSIYPFNFNNIAHNIGSHYKNSGTDAGLFVAPVAGVYQLNWNIFAQSTTDQGTAATMEMYVRKNGNTVSYLHNKKGYGNMGDDQEVIHLSVATQLAANDKVGVIFTAYSATWRIYGGHSTFSGFLVG